MNLLSDECIEPEFTNCIALPEIILGDTLDISHCSQGLSTTCYIEGSMTVNICFTSNDDILIDFDEEVLLHSIDYGVCVIDDIHFEEPHHPLDFLCEMDVFYDYYLDQMMSIVTTTLEEEGAVLSCDDEIRKLRSRYQRDLCVATCTFQGDKGLIYETKYCGTNTACCVLLEEWCIDENDEIQSTVLFHKTRGECDASDDWPCVGGSGSVCHTRDCPNT